MTARAEIVIVGAGPTGLTLAAQLDQLDRSAIRPAALESACASWGLLGGGGFGEGCTGTSHNGWLGALDQPSVATERTSSPQLTTQTARLQEFRWAVLGSNQ